MRVVSALFGLLAVSAITSDSGAAVTSNTLHGADGGSLDSYIFVGDPLSGLIPTELAGDNGWHPANPASTNGSLDPAGLPTFTNDSGESGLAGLLNDFPTTGQPTKRIQYDFTQATDIPGIQILTGNDGKDGRVFSTTAISASTDNGSTFSPVGLGYFESDLPGTVNSGQWGSTLVRIFDDAGGPLVTGATNLIFEFYAVDNTGGEYRDPFDGMNPYTNVDDGLSAAFVAPLVWEVDVIPEPASCLLLLTGLGCTLLSRRTQKS